MPNMESLQAAGLRCERCDCNAMYTGPVNVGAEAKCTECNHPLVGDHRIAVYGTMADPMTGAMPDDFEIAPEFR
jgi:hypothetical protein